MAGLALSFLCVYFHYWSYRDVFVYLSQNLEKDSKVQITFVDVIYGASLENKTKLNM